MLIDYKIINNNNKKKDIYNLFHSNAENIPHIFLFNCYRHKILIINNMMIKKYFIQKLNND